jgi:hypothetical protein
MKCRLFWWWPCKNFTYIQAQNETPQVSRRGYIASDSRLNRVYRAKYLAPFRTNEFRGAVSSRLIGIAIIFHKLAVTATLCLGIRWIWKGDD